MRSTALLLLLAWCTWTKGQADTSTAGGGLVISETVALSLSKGRIHEAAKKHWPFTFGQEPGARLEHADASTGMIEGTARLNYRSSIITAREETLGVISYRISIQSNNGQCTVQVSNFRHTGNSGAVGQGIDLGRIYKDQRPSVRVRGIGMSVAQRIHADMQQQCRDRVGQVVRAFAARLRQEQP
ncbi:MAG TPA: hypothetical protein VGE21_07835 [Flavobacteriales bacterium]